MGGTLLNDFLVGADPEMVLLAPPDLINGSLRGLPTGNYYGWDHNGFVLEPHPKPALSVREVVHNIRKSLHVVGHQFDMYKFRAGAYLHTPQRVVTLGGHVHLDMKTFSVPQINAMDIFAESLESVDILPHAECQQRSKNGAYGRKSDVRVEHGHAEYRSLCSWLFSQKTSMLAMTGIKLCAIAPDTVTAMATYPALRKWFESFKGKDDDVDWILDHDYLKTSGSMEAKPDNNIKTVWRIDNAMGANLLKRVPVEVAIGRVMPVPVLGTVRPFDDVRYRRIYVMDNGVRPEPATVRRAQARWDTGEIRRIEDLRGRIARIVAHNAAVEVAQVAQAAIVEPDPQEDIDFDDD